jgi:hypothetical protein
MLKLSYFFLPVVAASAFLSSAHAEAGFAEPPAAPSIAATASVVLTVAEHDAIRSELAKRRKIHLEQLLAYANAGEFPRNRLAGGPLNIFIDDQGHVCAAANLIRLDGHGDLVKKTARDDNFIVLATVDKGPLYDWMLASGFTQEEIAQIQEPYMPIGDLEPTIEPRPEPHFAAAPLSPEDERKRVQEVLRGVHKLLSANSEKSLNLVTQRLVARPKLARQMLASPIRVARR